MKNFEKAIKKGVKNWKPRLILLIRRMNAHIEKHCHFRGFYLKASIEYEEGLSDKAKRAYGSIPSICFENRPNNITMKLFLCPMKLLRVHY